MLNYDPPDIVQSYNKRLLSVPAPKWRDTADTFFELYQLMIEPKINGRMPEQQYLKCFMLEKEFLELYERAKATEKIKEKETNSRVIQPFYYTTCADKRHESVVRRLRERRFSQYFKRWKNSSI